MADGQALDYYKDRLADANLRQDLIIKEDRPWLLANVNTNFESLDVLKFGNARRLLIQSDGRDKPRWAEKTINASPAAEALIK